MTLNLTRSCYIVGMDKNMQITTHFPLANIDVNACEGDVLAFDFNREVTSSGSGGGFCGSSSSSSCYDGGNCSSSSSFVVVVVVVVVELVVVVVVLVVIIAVAISVSA